MGSNGLPSSVSDLFVGDVVSVRDAEEFSNSTTGRNSSGSIQGRQRHLGESTVPSII